MATGRTYDLIVESGCKAEKIKKLYEGRPNIYDAITNGEIQLIINTPSTSDDSTYDDSYIRKAAIKERICFITTIAAARAAAKGILEVKKSRVQPVYSLQELHGRL